jgi:beta-1,4-N-acetylglucosaminyltransferase
MKIGLVCTHGGHLTELLQVMDAFQGHTIFFATYYSSRDAEIRAMAPAYFCRNIGERLWLILYSLFWALQILLRERPDVLFSTGSEIALPFLFWGKILGIRSIFLESLCQVYRPSRTGKIAYRLADIFWVQWPQLVSGYGPKTEYHGSVI